MQCKKRVKTQPAKGALDRRNPPDHQCGRPVYRDGYCKRHHPDNKCKKCDGYGFFRGYCRNHSADLSSKKNMEVELKPENSEPDTLEPDRDGYVQPTNSQYAQCGNCRFYFCYSEFSEEDGDDLEYGNCQRYPPILTPEAVPFHRYPVVHFSQWCGEWVKRKS